MIVVHRAVIEEEVKTLWGILRYEGHGNKTAIKRAANQLEGFLKLIARNQPNDCVYAGSQITQDGIRIEGRDPE